MPASGLWGAPPPQQVRSGLDTSRSWVRRGSPTVAPQGPLLPPPCSLPRPLALQSAPLPVTRAGHVLLRRRKDGQRAPAPSLPAVLVQRSPESHMAAAATAGMDGHRQERLLCSDPGFCRADARVLVTTLQRRSQFQGSAGAPAAPHSVHTLTPPQLRDAGDSFLFLLIHKMLSRKPFRVTALTRTKGQCPFPPMTAFCDVEMWATGPGKLSQRTWKEVLLPCRRILSFCLPYLISLAGGPVPQGVALKGLLDRDKRG